METLHPFRKRHSLKTEGRIASWVHEETKQNRFIQTLFSDNIHWSILFLALWLLIPNQSTAQIKGEVLDAQSLHPLPYVLITFKDGKQIETGPDGKFTFSPSPQIGETIKFQHMDYKEETYFIMPGTKNLNISFLLQKQNPLTMKTTNNTNKGKFSSLNNRNPRNYAHSDEISCNCLPLLISIGFHFF